MKVGVRKVMEALWPPIPAWRTNAHLKKQIQDRLASDDEYRRAFDDLLAEFKKTTDHSTLLSEARRIEEAETDRKEMVESKASALANATGLAVTLVALVPTVLGTDWGLAKPVAVMSALAFVLATVHLLVAVDYAVSVSVVAPFYMSSTSTVKRRLEKCGFDEASLAAEKLVNAQMNVPALIVKTNCLSVAQDLFVRGIALLAIGAFPALLNLMVR
jgi:hypothetical protein